MTTLAAGRRRVESVASAALAAAALVLYVPVLRDLVAVWYQVSYYSYGFLVPIFSAYLIWETRGSRSATGSPGRSERRPGESEGGVAPFVRIVGGHLGAPMLIAAGLLLLAAGVTAESLTLRALSAPVVVYGLVLAAWGVERAWRLAFPIGFLVLAAPLPEGALPALSLPLQQLAAVVAERTLRALGAPVTRDGLYVGLRSVTLHVTEACNGLRFLLAMLVIGVACAGVTQRRPLTRAAVVVAALALAIGANLVRVTGTGILAEAFGPWAAMGRFHVIWGKVVYAAALVPFAATVLVLRKR